VRVIGNGNGVKFRSAAKKLAAEKKYYNARRIIKAARDA